MELSGFLGVGLSGESRTDEPTEPVTPVTKKYLIPTGDSELRS